MSVQDIYKSKSKHIAYFIILFLLFSALFTFYRREQSKMQKRAIDFINIQIARRFQGIIMSRARVLTVLSHQIANHDIDDEKTFQLSVSDYVEQFPLFYAINWVNPAGVIQWVYPENRNANARNKNLLLRPEISPYLATSKDQKKYVMSHVVDLYQGPKGLVFYFPIYNGKFMGWLNGVFTYESILNEFIVENDYDGYNVHIRNNSSSDDIYNYGAPLTRAANTYKFNVLGHEFEVDVEPKSNTLEVIEILLAYLIYFIALIVSALLTRLSYTNSIQNFNLNRVCTKLKFSNSIVGLLTHDFSNQVLVVENNLKKLQQAVGENPLFDKIKKTIELQLTMIRKANDIQKKDFLENDFMLEKTNVVEQIQQSIETFEKPISDKHLKILFKYDSNELYILTDAVYFQNNLMNNILSNAIKFSYPETQIEIYAFKNTKEIIIEIRDYGVGMTSSQLEELKKYNGKTSTQGTAGELGTGLGLLQVQTFVGIFNGKMDVYSGTQEVETGTLIILSFPVA